MSIRDLRDKYGKNLKGRQAVNAAIRAELIGGDACLEALQALHVLTTKLRQHDLPDAERAQRALNVVREIADEMSAVIARRYGLGDRH